MSGSSRSAAETPGSARSARMLIARPVGSPTSGAQPATACRCARGAACSQRRNCLPHPATVRVPTPPDGVDLAGGEHHGQARGDTAGDRRSRPRRGRTRRPGRSPPGRRPLLRRRRPRRPRRGSARPHCPGRACCRRDPAARRSLPPPRARATHRRTRCCRRRRRRGRGSAFCLRGAGGQPVRQRAAATAEFAIAPARGAARRGRRPRGSPRPDVRARRRPRRSPRAGARSRRRRPRSPRAARRAASAGWPPGPRTRRRSPGRPAPPVMIWSCRSGRLPQRRHASAKSLVLLVPQSPDPAAGLEQTLGVRGQPLGGGAPRRRRPGPGCPRRSPGRPPPRRRPRASPAPRLPNRRIRASTEARHRAAEPMSRDELRDRVRVSRGHLQRDRVRHLHGHSAITRRADPGALRPGAATSRRRR